MIRVVIDTNVLVSAMISSSGNEAFLLLAISQELVQPCFSPEMLEEYVEVLLRPTFGFQRSEVEALLAMVRQRGLSFDSITRVRVSPDPEDDKFIACAVAAKAQFLVTGNKKHFPVTGSFTVVSAGEFLRFLASRI